MSEFPGLGKSIGPLSGTWDSSATDELFRQETARDVTIMPRSRRFLFWMVSPEHLLIKNAKVDITLEGATIVPTEAVIKVAHPWWERAAFYVVEAVTPRAGR